MNLVRNPKPLSTSVALPTCTVSGMVTPASVEACRLSMDAKTNTATATTMNVLRMDDSSESRTGSLPNQRATIAHPKKTTKTHTRQSSSVCKAKSPSALPSPSVTPVTQCRQLSVLRGGVGAISVEVSVELVRIEPTTPSLRKMASAELSLLLACT